jgi:hypothetical protein
MFEEVNSEFSNEPSNSKVGGAHVTSILGHNWIEGRLKLKVQWDTEQTTWEEVRDCKEDNPIMTAEYIVNGNVTRSKRSDRTLDWAKKTLQDFKRIARRISRLYDV